MENAQNNATPVKLDATLIAALSAISGVGLTSTAVSLVQGQYRMAAYSAFATGVTAVVAVRKIMLLPNSPSNNDQPSL